MQPLNPHKKEEMRNLILAVAASALILFGFEYYERITTPPAPAKEQAQLAEAQAAAPKTVQEALGASATPSTQTPALLGTKRINIKSNALNGSLALTGGRVDKLTLPRYLVKMGDDAKITLFKPSGVQAHYFDAGWVGYNGVTGPDNKTPWQLVSGAELTPSTPVVLEWRNNTGQIFRRTFSLSQGDYGIRVNDVVQNTSGQPASFAHYAQVHKSGGQKAGETSSFYNFFGPQGFVDNERINRKYSKLEDEDFTVAGKTGWWGISSQYFLSAIVPDQENGVHNFRFKHTPLGEEDFYSAIIKSDVLAVPAGGQLENAYRLYAGPKKYSELKKEGAGLQHAVNYGWFSFLAEPFFKAMMWFYDKTGNMGVAIILLTLCLKVLVFPLANKSYKAMQRMKEIQPKLAQLKEQYGDDRERFTKEMMNFYKREKVNPASGCWPVLIQIPIFFAIYKVILVSFEFRHTPFMFWIEDLSAKDPFFVLPLLMGASMFVQMQLSPPPPDPVQRQVMKLMPVMFTVLFLMFPAGLVLYWLVNNLFSIVQQWAMMRHYAKQK